MIKHIVLWKLKEHAEGAAKAENAMKIKALLESLAGKMPGLLKIEVSVDLGLDEGGVDLCLYSEFENRAALAAYQEHPLHAAMKPFIGACREERRVIDYEI